jgi:hypothetical protein
MASQLGFDLGSRVGTRTNSTVLPYPNPGAIARESISATTESI